MLRVVMAMDVFAYHADLTRHGEAWHKEPMTIWADWLAPYLGNSLADPAVRETAAPSWWDGGLTFGTAVRGGE